MFWDSRIDSEFKKIWRFLDKICCWQKNICTKIDECLGILRNTGDKTFVLNQKGEWIQLNTEIINAYGAFHDEFTQTAAINTPTPIKMRSTTISNGVLITNDSEINLAFDGIYNIQFSAQLERQAGGGGGKKIVNIWLRVNGADIPWTSTFIGFVSNSVETVASWNFFYEANAGDKIELIWYQDDDIHMITLPQNSYPATPSVIVTVNKVG